MHAIDLPIVADDADLLSALDTMKAANRSAALARTAAGWRLLRASEVLAALQRIEPHQRAPTVAAGMPKGGRRVAVLDLHAPNRPKLAFADLKTRVAVSRAKLTSTATSYGIVGRVRDDQMPSNPTNERAWVLARDAADLHNLGFTLVLCRCDKTKTHVWQPFQIGSDNKCPLGDGDVSCS